MATYTSVTSEQDAAADKSSCYKDNKKTLSAIGTEDAAKALHLRQTLSYSPIQESPLKVVSRHMNRLVLLVPLRGAGIYLESL